MSALAPVPPVAASSLTLSSVAALVAPAPSCDVARVLAGRHVVWRCDPMAQTRRAALGAVLALCAAAVVRAQPGVCDDEYECVFQDKISNQWTNITFSFDLRPLCYAGASYFVADNGGHNYSFSICGTSTYQCLPPWPDVYTTGVAVQYFGDVPVCNTSAPACRDYFGNPACCTADCQVLGVGPPLWQLQNPSNPETGGILVTHRGVPPSYVLTLTLTPTPILMLKVLLILARSHPCLYSY
jgi:hypothetical protein